MEEPEVLPPGQSERQICEWQRSGRKAEFKPLKNFVQASKKIRLIGEQRCQNLMRRTQVKTSRVGNADDVAVADGTAKGRRGVTLLQHIDGRPDRDEAPHARLRSVR